MYLHSFFLAMAMAAAVMAQTPDIVTLLKSTPSLSQLLDLVSQQKGLVDTLAKAQDITILAPSNDAFSTFLNSPQAALYKQNPDALLELLKYHVLQTKVPASAFSSTPVFVPTLATDSAYTNVTGGQVVEGILNGTTVEIISGESQVSKVIKADVQFTGGIVHIIDKVLTLPQAIATTAVANGATAAAQAFTSTDIDATIEALSDLTVFVPDNAAFQAISSIVSKLTTAQIIAVLKLHAIQQTNKVYYSTQLKNGASIPTLNGESVKISIVDNSIFINKAKVVKPNLLTANGVIHVIDSVLIPTTNSTSTSPTASSGATNPNKPTGSPIVPYENVAPLSTRGAFGVVTATVAVMIVFLAQGGSIAG